MITSQYVLIGFTLGLFMGVSPIYIVYLISNRKDKEYIKQIMKG